MENLTIHNQIASNKTKTWFIMTAYNIVENLCIGAGLPIPKIYVIDDSAPNAFATGRDPKHASIALTTGLLNKLEKIELEGVVGHELSHIRNYDTRIMVVVSVLVGFVALLAYWFFRASWFRSSDRDDRKSGGVFVIVALILAILAPLIAQVIKAAISRRREFLADASSALLTRYPDGLADALMKISSDKEVLEVANLVLTSTQERDFEKEVSEVIEFGINKLSTVDVQNIDPSFVITQNVGIVDKDEPIPSLETNQVLQNSQDTKEDLFKIKAVFE